MFGIFDELENSVSNALNIGVGLLTLNEDDEINKKSVSKLISDGLEIGMIASMFNVGEDFIERLVDSVEDDE